MENRLLDTKVKLLLVNDFEYYSGTEKLIWAIKRELENKGYNVLFTLAENSLQFSHILNTFKPDVIDFHNIRRIGIFPVKIALERKIPITHSIHDYTLLCKNINHFNFETEQICKETTWDNCKKCQSIYRYNLPYPPHVFNFMKENRIPLIVPSEYVRNLYTKFGYPEELLFLAYHGIDLVENFKEEDKNFILFIGPDRIFKGRHIAEELSRKLPYEFKILGTVTGRMGKEQPGFIEEKELEKHRRQCSLLLYPSIWEEVCGLVHLEVMKYKKPVVAFKYGSIPEYVKHTTINSKNEMFNKIVELMEDKKLRRRWGEENYLNLKENFTTEKMVTSRLKIYEEVGYLGKS